MPELPEVETIARNLRIGIQNQPALLNRCILGADLLWERTLAEPSPAVFASRLVGQVIEDIGRRGKFLYFQLNRDWLLFHLRMSGDLLVKSVSASPEIHDRLVLYLDGDIKLVFNDARNSGGYGWWTRSTGWWETWVPNRWTMGFRARPHCSNACMPPDGS
jgi:formamidopyrimidine-DNA glycosylase